MSSGTFRDVRGGERRSENRENAVLPPCRALSPRAETTETIGRWADDTFGTPGDCKSRALKLLGEAVELCAASGVREEQIRSTVRESIEDAGRKGEWGNAGKIPEELADCDILIRTLAYTARIDLEYYRDWKMTINRSRSWRVDPDNPGAGQHISEGPFDVDRLGKS